MLTDRDRQALYRNERYLELADQIENHSRAIGYLMAEMQDTFPRPGYDWRVVNHRPYLIDQHEENDE